MSEQILCLSYFDQVIGPDVFYCNHDYEEEGPDFPDLTRILEFNEEEGTFIFAFRKYQTINHIFYIDSQFARGKKELLMISYIIRSAFFKNEITDVFKYLDSKKPELEEMAREIEKIDGLAKILNERSSSLRKLASAPLDFKNEFTNIFQRYTKKLSPRNITLSSSPSRKEIKKFFIFGARGVGKTTFLKNMEAIQYHNRSNNDLPNVIYEMVINNTEIMSYNCIDKNFVCEQCDNYNNCLKKSQGYIFIINASNLSTLKKSKERYQKIVNHCNDLSNDKTPVLIIGNKFNNKENITTEMVEESFNLKDAEECGMKIKYFPINVSEENKKIMDSLRWLIQNMI